MNTHKTPHQKSPALRDIPFGRPIIGAPEQAAVTEVLSGHILTHGPKCSEFEALFAARIGCRYAITVSSCTTALHLSLLAHGIGPGDEVVVPAQTHVATAHSVEHTGAKPVFVDVERATGNLSVEAIEAAITPRTRAITVVHYLGLPCDMDNIAKVAGRHNLHIIEDCALALGATIGDQKPGSIGATGCFSFYPSKHITTMEGGMLTTNDPLIAENVRRKRAFGYDKGQGERSQPGIYDINMLGFNFRMSEGQAAIGVCQLDRLDGFLDTRRANTATLLAGLSEIDEVTTFPVEIESRRSSCYCVNAVLPEDNSLDRARVVDELTQHGIGTSVHYPVALPLSCYYKEKYGGRVSEFPVAHWIANNSISLPVGPHLDENDMSYVVLALKGAVQRAKQNT